MYTPVNVDMLKLELAKHADRKFVNNLCNGLTFGFDTLISDTEVTIKEYKNLRSAITQPEIVDKLIESEVSKGFLEGPRLENQIIQESLGPRCIVWSVNNNNLDLTSIII